MPSTKKTNYVNPRHAVAASVDLEALQAESLFNLHKQLWQMFATSLFALELLCAILGAEMLVTVSKRWVFIQITACIMKSYTVFAFWCKRGLVCMCFEPFTPIRKYGVEYSERSEMRFRMKSVDFRKRTVFWRMEERETNSESIKERKRQNGRKRAKAGLAKIWATTS